MRIDVLCPTAVRRLPAVAVLTLLVLSTLLLAYHNTVLNERLIREETRIDGLSSLLEKHERQALRRDEFSTVRARLETTLSRTDQRVSALEARSEAITRAIAMASQSIVFLQGAYGFVEAETGRPLRHVLGPDGRPMGTRRGPAVTLEGTGPLVEAQFTGTAFVAARGGLLLTNRHVALPWEANDVAGVFTQRDLMPVMHRFVGYLPGSQDPFDVELVSASEDADVALLHGTGIPTHIPHLELSRRPLRVGDDVIVMGYPTGIRALLTRAEPRFIEELKDGDDVDFWSVGRRLSEGRHIRPLATRGIIGQLTPAAVVYDAETARGGSGGPVLGLDGTVVAVNAAILPEFDGSNLGVPAEPALRLLASTTRRPLEPGLAMSQPTGATSGSALLASQGSP